MDLNSYCPKKVLNAREAVSKINEGDRVFIGTGCGEPQHLIRAMVENKALQDIVIYQMLSSTLSEYIDDESFFRRFNLKLFFISRSMRQAALTEKLITFPNTFPKSRNFL